MVKAAFNPIKFALVPGVAEGQRDHYQSVESCLKTLNAAIKHRNIMYTSLAIAAIMATLQTVYGGFSIPVRYPSAIVACMSAQYLVAANINMHKNISRINSLFSIFSRKPVDETGAKEESTLALTKSVTKTKFVSENLLTNAVIAGVGVASVYKAIYDDSLVELTPYGYVGVAATVHSIYSAAELFIKTYKLNQIARREAMVFSLLSMMSQSD